MVEGSPQKEQQQRGGGGEEVHHLDKSAATTTAAERKIEKKSSPLKLATGQGHSGAADSIVVGASFAGHIQLPRKPVPVISFPPVCGEEGEEFLEKRLGKREILRLPLEMGSAQHTKLVQTAIFHEGKRRQTAATTATAVVTAAAADAEHRVPEHPPPPAPPPPPHLHEEAAEDAAAVDTSTKPVTAKVYQYHLLPDEFAIDNAQRWDELVMQPLLRRVTETLGCSEFAPIQATLAKLLMYQKGAVVPPHRSAERRTEKLFVESKLNHPLETYKRGAGVCEWRTPLLFGKLVIQLPSDDFDGAHFSVYHPLDLSAHQQPPITRRREEPPTLTSSDDSSSRPAAAVVVVGGGGGGGDSVAIESLSSLASAKLAFEFEDHEVAPRESMHAFFFYADCLHELGEMYSGGPRLVLVYDLSAAGHEPSWIHKRVIFTGLVGREDLNGKTGFAVSWEAEKGRFGVCVDDSEEIIAVKPENLRVVYDDKKKD